MSVENEVGRKKLGGAQCPRSNINMPLKSIRWEMEEENPGITMTRKFLRVTQFVSNNRKDRYNESQSVDIIIIENMVFHRWKLFVALFLVQAVVSNVSYRERLFGSVGCHHFEQPRILTVLLSKSWSLGHTLHAWGCFDAEEG